MSATPPEGMRYGDAYVEDGEVRVKWFAKLSEWREHNPQSPLAHYNAFPYAGRWYFSWRVLEERAVRAATLALMTVGITIPDGDPAR